MKTLTSKLNNRHIEGITAGITALALYFGLAVYAPGGPLSSDVLWYINAGMNGIKDAFILNRYFHVYLQGVFIGISPTPLVGHQYFWAFLIAATCLFIYISARLFSKSSSPLHGVLAVALFLSIKAIADTTGIALVDTSVMFMVMAITMVYLISLRLDHRSSWLVVLLGFLFFLAFKTKETTLITGILLIGLGYSSTGEYKWITLLKRLPYLLAGALAGVVVFMILSGIFLGDVFYGMRPREFVEFFQTYVADTAEAAPLPGRDTWYNNYFYTFLWFPFTLFLLSGARSALDGRMNAAHRLVWLLPLAAILFVSLVIGSQWGFMPRFIFPSLPLIAMLGPQFLELNLPAELKRRIFAIVWLGLIMGALLGFRLFLRAYLTAQGQDTGIFLVTTVTPLFLTIIFALVFFRHKLRLFESFLILAMTVAIISVPLSENFYSMVRDRRNDTESQRLFYPFKAFSGLIAYSEEMQVYASRHAWGVMGAGHYSKDTNETASLFNIYFDASATKDHFTLSSEPQEILTEVLKQDYTYVFLSMEDWEWMAAQPGAQSALESRYQVYYEPQQKLVLLMK